MWSCDTYHQDKFMCLFLPEFLLLFWKNLMLIPTLLFNIFWYNITVKVLHIHYYLHNVTSAISDGIVIHIINFHVLKKKTAISATWYHTSHPFCIPLFFTNNNWHTSSFVPKLWWHLKGSVNCIILEMELSNFRPVVLAIDWSGEIILGWNLMRGLSEIINMILAYM